MRAATPLQPLEKNATLIALEGVDGSGKTTAGLRLVEKLEGDGHSVSWHPNRSMRPLRQALENLAREDGFRDRFEMLGRNEAQLISAVAKWRDLLELRADLARDDHVVVVDRYKYAHLALTEAFETTNGEIVRRMFEVYPDADQVFYFDVESATAAERVNARGVDRNAVEFLERFSVAFKELPEFGAFTVLDAQPSADDVFATLCATLRLLPER